jgi:hypothetical protein
MELFCSSKRCICCHRFHFSLDDENLSVNVVVVIIYLTFGCTYFLQSLRSITADAGRNVRREHLLIVADSLSVRGQFHGLSSQGLKKQRNRLSISSPFSEACFSVSIP